MEGQLPTSVIKAGGFKMKYNQVKKTVMTCEIDKNSDECKKMLKELNIDIIENA